MNYRLTEVDGGKYAISITDSEGNFYQIGDFEERQPAYDVKFLLDMTESVWAYHGDLENNRYIEEYCTDKALPYDTMKQYAKDHWDFLNENYHTEYAGTDSEGVSYNCTKHN